MSRPTYLRYSRFRLSASVALGATAIASAFAAGSSQATTGSGPAPGADAPVAVQPGISAAALPGAVPFGTTPPGTTETVSFVLRERNLPQLERAVEHGVRDYLSVSEFARGYGASLDSIDQLTGYLAAYGISTRVYPDHVDVVATGTAADFDAALSVTQKQYHVPEQHGKDGTAAIPAQDVHGTAQAPLLPSRIARNVLSVLGLTNYGPFGSQAVHVNASTVAPQAGSTNGCLALTGLPGACHLPSDYAGTYGLSALYAKGATGAGRTEAIVTLAALDPGAPEYFWQNVAHTPASGRTVNMINVDGGSGAPSNASNSAETDLDTEQAGALAPGANVVVYQAPNSDSGFADAFFYAASQNTADTVSTSWLESETYLRALIAGGTESPSYEPAFDEAFLEMAAQGQSGFAPAGDQAAYAASADLGTTDLSVDASGDSPYITAAGGTTLPWSGQLSGPAGTATVTVPAQRTWGSDYLWGAISAITGRSLPAAAGGNLGGTGGGFSAIEPSPAYQANVPGTRTYHAVEYLTPENEQLVGKTSLTEPNQWSFNGTPSVTEGPASGRAVPDVSADADPYSGYLIYAPSFADAGYSLLEGGWGGTSFVAPQFSGSTAVIDSLLGHRVGLWNPAIYGFATGPGSPFTPIDQAGTGSDNLYYTGNPGQPYNPGSGLGYPDFGKLAADYAAGPAGARG